MSDTVRDWLAIAGGAVATVLLLCVAVPWAFEAVASILGSLPKW